jgi:hypothetical protein
MSKLNRLITLVVAIVLVGALAGGGLLFYRMVDHMERITILMGSIADNVAGMQREMGAMGKEVAAMNGEMRLMRESMTRMEASMARVGGAIDQGAKQIERFNPMKMMEGGSWR